jgi:hypothetical protein
MATRYDDLVTRARASLQQSRLRVKDDDLDFHHQAVADTSALLAIAEQARIANLLTVALDNQRPMGSTTFPHKARFVAMKEALSALGLPEGEG